MSSRSSYFSVLLILGLSVTGCSKDEGGTSAGIPLTEPPVTKATPSGLKSTSLMLRRRGEFSNFALDINEVKSRFFSSGPTQISELLKNIDTRIQEINTRSSESTHECLSATPVEQSITVMGNTEKAYFQCYDVFGDNTGGMLFGKNSDTWYLYQNVGAQRSLAKVTPVSGASGEYTVEAWFSVGQSNTSGCSSTWYGCSYGVIHLKANSSTSAIEMTVAGTGFGYCGAHLKSEGTNLFIQGSSGGSSDGTTWSCQAADTSCTLASSLTTSGSCGDIGVSSFELTSLGVSASSVGSGITLNGTSSDHVHFGPEVGALSAISGVSKF